MTQAPPPPHEAVERLEARKAVLAAAADLFEEVEAFMESVIPRTYAALDAAETEALKAPLRLKHMQALRIRDDYRSSAKENRDDVALLEAQAAHLRKVEEREAVKDRALANLLAIVVKLDEAAAEIARTALTHFPETDGEG